MSIKIKRKKMIYRNIEKIVLETPNDMELGKKIRELYRREVDSLENNQWDEDHALDQVLNSMLEDLEEE